MIFQKVKKKANFAEVKSYTIDTSVLLLLTCSTQTHPFLSQQCRSRNVHGGADLLLGIDSFQLSTRIRIITGLIRFTRAELF